MEPGPSSELLVGQHWRAVHKAPILEPDGTCPERSRCQQIADRGADRIGGASGSAGAWRTTWVDRLKRDAYIGAVQAQDPAQRTRVPREMMLGQIEASLRPANIDRVRVRQMLLVALRLGFDPRALYQEALDNRPPGWGEKPPPLEDVLPPTVLPLNDGGTGVAPVLGQSLREMTAEALSAEFAKLGASEDVLEWSRGKTLGEAWSTCERADWMLWLASRLCERRLVVSAACACAETALRFVPAGEDRPRIAIETARRWTRGEATLDDVRAAADAAYDADCAAASAAAYAAYDADSPAVFASAAAVAYAGAYAVFDSAPDAAYDAAAAAAAAAAEDAAAAAAAAAAAGGGRRRRGHVRRRQR